MQNTESLSNEIRGCRLCAAHLPFEPRPVFQFSRSARILIAGQAPGRKVHESGVAFKDGNNLWLKRNPWFEEELIPIIRGRVVEIMQKVR